MYREITGQTGRLVLGYDVLTEFDGWRAVANWSGEPGAEDTRPGARLMVVRHKPDDLNWSLRKDGDLKVELDLGERGTYSGAAVILFEEPTLTIDIVGALEAQ